MFWTLMRSYIRPAKVARGPGCEGRTIGRMLEQCNRALKAMFEWLCRLLVAGFDGVHIHCCGHGHLGFRSYGESLWKSRNAGPAQSNQRAPAPASGPSLGLGVPSLRRRSGGTPPQAIHGLMAASSASLPSCPLRNACVRPSGGGRQIKIKSQSQAPRRSRLAGEEALGWGGDLADAFAGKPAPTGGGGSPPHSLQAGRKAAVRFCFCF